MQLTISKWEYLIRIMGDCMAPGKRAGYIVNYECKQGKWKFPKPGKKKVLEDANKAGGVVTLRYLHADEAISMLGMYFVSDINNVEQVEYIHKQATAWEKSIISGGVQYNEA